jgi:sulfoxide reductase heme-binding subunit YedZ
MEKRVKRYLVEGSLVLPAVIFLLIPVVFGMWGEKTWKKLLIQSGFITLSVLIFSLVLSPLNRFFTKWHFIKFFNRFRREIGLTVFFYACFHFFCFIMRAIEKKGWFDPHYFLHPVVIPGLFAFLLLLLLAVTSNNWSIKKMGYRKWKGLHRLIYVGEIAVFIHVYLKSSVYALALILPLVCIQIGCYFFVRRNQ